MAVVGLDDTRHDAYFGTLNDIINGLPDRSRTPICQIIQLLIMMGRHYRYHGTTLGPCWTSRTEWFVGNAWPRHGFNPDSGPSDLAGYQRMFVNGEIRSPINRDPEWFGPYNSSLSARMGLPDTRVTQAEQEALGVTRSNPGGVPDDIQLRSGTVFQEVARADIPICYLGKYNNQHRATDNVPAGITHWHAEIMTVETGGQWAGDFQEYEGPNPYDGLGVATGPANHYNYDRSGINNIGNWSSLGGGRVRIGGAAGHRFEDKDVGNYVVQVTGCAIPEYNGLWKLVAIGTAPDGSSPTTTHCWFECQDFGTISSGAGHLYNRTEMPIHKYSEWAEDFIDECVTNDTPGLLWICPHQTHSAGGGDTPSGYGACIEKTYDGTVNPAQGPYFNGSSGAWCDTADPSQPVSVQQVWEKCMEQMATIDDFLGRLVNKLESARPGNWYLILTSDQGIQLGEQWTRGDHLVKTAVWEGSRKSFMIIVGPNIPWGETFDRPTMHADIPATVLDMLGLTDNHIHSRDGVSLLRIVDPEHPAYNRVIPNFGDYKGGSGNGQSFLGPDLMKFVRPVGMDYLGKIYDMRKPPDGDYETSESTPTDLAYRNDLMDALIAAVQNNTTDSNPLNDGSIVL